MSAAGRPAVAAVVLAAGQSRRMGGDNKLLADIGGAPMIARVVDALLDAPVSDIVVVTGHERARVAQALAGRPVRLLHNPDHARGMSTSLCAGIRALAPDVDAALVCLGDMPGVRAGHIEALVAAFAPDAGRAICIPVHAGRRGHPVLFGAAFFDEVCAITGDVGARAVLDAHASAAHAVPVDDRGILVDVDTADALAAVRAAPIAISEREP